MQSCAPLSSFVDLSDLSDAGKQLIIAPNAHDREQLAAWAGVNAIDAFEAHIELGKLSPTRFSYRAQVNADLVQTCVVTLEPVRSRLKFAFSRDLQLVRGMFDHSGERVTTEMGDDAAPEQITDSKYDIAVPVLEEFALAIDPYPRAPGVMFEPILEAEGQESNPFAVLKELKNKH